MMTAVSFRVVMLMVAVCTAWGQCTSQKCSDTNTTAQAPRWENGAVFLEQVLKETSSRIARSVEKQMAELQESIDKRLTHLENGLKESTADIFHRLDTIENAPPNNRTEQNALDQLIGDLGHQMVDSLVKRLDRHQQTVLNQTSITLDTRLRENAMAMNSNLAEFETTLISRFSAILANASRAKLPNHRCELSDQCGVFLRRLNGEVNFTRSWEDYREGFGNTSGEFWLGLEKLHQCTTQCRYKLRVDLTDWNETRLWAEYSTFSVADETQKYRVTMFGYNVSSTTEDSLAIHNGQMFTTFDHDNDLWDQNCATRYKGGWWHQRCNSANPTGVYKPEGYTGRDSIHWYYAYDDRRSLKYVEFSLVLS